jgi:hypothetical protein
MSSLVARLSSTAALVLAAGLLAGAGPSDQPSSEGQSSLAKAPIARIFEVDPSAPDQNPFNADPAGRTALTAGRTAQSITPNLFEYVRTAGIQFTPRNSAETYAYAGYGCMYQTSGSGDYITPLNIPDGAVLKYLRIYYNDTSASNITAFLTKYDPAVGYTDITSVLSSGSAGYGTSLSAEMNEVVDTTNHAYVLIWRPGTSSSANQFCGTRVAYYFPSDGHFTAIAPCRLVDTRAPAFPAPLGGGWLPPATVRSYNIANVCGLPAGVKAVSLNATVTAPAGPGFLTLYPEGGAFPPVSTLNFWGGDTIVNAAIVPLSATGGISMALGVSGGHVILDINGYYY